MIPYRDENQSRSFPIITMAIIAINGWVFWKELKLTDVGLASMFWQYGLTPQRVMHPGDLVGLKTGVKSFVTSMFLHAGIMHFIGNMWFLWIFGDNVEDRLGHFRFLVFYLLCGIAAGLTHMVLNMHSRVPCVGASGAIAGVLGAYFLLFPRSRVRVLIPIFFILPIVISLPAVIFIGLWFVMQLMNGMAAIGPQAAATGTAWWAHIGGFVAGIFLVSQLRSARERQRVPVRYVTYRRY